MAFLDHLGMTCQWPTWRSRNLDSETPVPRQVRWFFRPATHISSRSDHLHWHHCQKVTDILTSWWFQTVLIFTTWTDDLFLTRIFQMFFLFHQLFVRSNLTLRWWFSWRRIMEPFISWVVFQHSFRAQGWRVFGFQPWQWLRKTWRLI